MAGATGVNSLSASVTFAAVRRCCIARSSTYTPRASTTTRKLRRRQSSSGSCRTSFTTPLMARRPQRLLPRAPMPKLPNMGLTRLRRGTTRKADVRIAKKNYLDEAELKKLNSLVSAYFDAAEFRAQTHEPTYMKDWLAHLDRLIVALDAPTLSGAGSVSHQQATARAESEYESIDRFWLSRQTRSREPT